MIERYREATESRAAWNGTLDGDCKIIECPSTCCGGAFACRYTGDEILEEGRGRGLSERHVQASRFASGE